MIRVLVFGGRSYANKARVVEVLDRIHRERVISLIVHGDCNEHLRQRKLPADAGADQFADAWARWRGVPVARFPALWDAYGTAAGPKRNRWMPEHVAIDLGVGFPGGSGTGHMAQVLRERLIEVMEVAP